jgi:3-methylcrotonyl-CoA carboxylase beta subunit
VRRDDHRHRPGCRHRVRDRRQRRHGQGRHLLPDDGEEAPARAGSGAGERLPCIYLVDSGGAFLPLQDEVFPDREHFGRIFYNQARLSARNIPQIAVVMGSCTAGGAYVPAMSDESVIVREQGTIFLGGPPLVKAATGEVVDAESLGGAEVHTSHFRRGRSFRRERCHALGIAREIVAHLNRRKPMPLALRDPIAPRYAAEEIYGIVPRDTRIALRHPRDHRAHRRRLEFQEFKARYGKTLVTRLRPHPRLSGRHRRQQRHPVRRERAQGRAFHRAVQPAQHPAGVPAEHHRLHGGSQVRERRHRQGRRQDGHRGGLLARAQVHRRHRRQLRRGQLRHVRPCLPAALPVDVAERAHQRDGRRAGRQRARHGEARRPRSRGQASWSADEEDAFKAPIRAQYERQGHPYYASARLWDDGIIDPADTRRVLGLAISASLNAPIEPSNFGVFRM